MDETNNIQTITAEPEDTVLSTTNTPDPEIERLRAENVELRTAVRLRDARERMADLLRAADAHSPELLLDSVKADLQFSDDGELQNAAALVERMKRRFPEQFGKRQPAASIDGGAGTGSPTQMISAESLARMTPAQIQKLDWAEVRRILSS
ncbi:MAG: hypothetical protein IT174_02490 [Acidobacteria bacterium]|nr:hypothetical protein [Acidobacteriota bacterium]